MPKTYFDDYFKKPAPAVAKAENSKLAKFSARIGFAPYPFDDDEREVATKLLFGEFFRVFEAAGLRRNSIELVSRINRLRHYVISVPEPDERQKKSWFHMRYTEPGRAFTISLSDTEFEIAAENLKLHNVVQLAAEVFHQLMASMTGAPLADALKVHERAMSVDYVFRCEYRIETDKVQLQIKKNHQIIHKALELERKVSAGRAETNAFPSLGMESFIRVDFNQHGLKQFRGQPYNIKVRAEAPFNEGNSIIYVSAVLAMEEEFGFELLKAVNTEIPLIDFYREIILKRFIDNLLCTVDYSTP